MERRGTSWTEITLAKKLRQGSRLALERAIDRFTPYVSAVVVRVLAGQGAREDVEELTADVFLALWAHAGELNPEQGLRPWLGTVAQDRAWTRLRTHEARAPPARGRPAPPAAPDPGRGGAAEWAAGWQDSGGLDRPNRTPCSCTITTGVGSDIAHF